MNFDVEFLEARLEKLENSANHLMFVIDNEASSFRVDGFLRQTVIDTLTKSAAVRRKLAELE